MRYVLAIIVGYIFGNVMSAYFAGKRLQNIDIREYGSGNTGATNAWRVLGSRPGIFVVIIDILKGFIAVAIGKLIGGSTGAILAGIAVILGHNYPAILKFKGGKGVATSLGVVLFLMPWVALTCILVAFITIRASKYVSLGSMLGMISAPITAWIYGYGKKHILMALFIVILGIARHRDNIKRLFNGTENKINLGRGHFF